MSLVKDQSWKVADKLPLSTPPLLESTNEENNN